MKKTLLYLFLGSSLLFAPLGYAGAAGTTGTAAPGATAPGAAAPADPAASPALEETPEPLVEPAGDAEDTTAFGIGAILGAAAIMILAIFVVVRFLGRRR